MTVQTFVTIHDHALIEQCEAEGRFAGLDDVTYLFVGPRPCGPVPAPTILSRGAADNIEQWPHLYDFTGWWTLAHHRLIHADKAMFLQYDMRPAVPDLEQQVSAALDEHPMAAFICGHRSASNWMLLLEGFEADFRAGLALRDADLPPPDFEEWPSTQGTAWGTEDFVEFMHWVRPMLDVWAPNVWAGHLAERAPYAWLRHTGRTWANLPGGIHHDHYDCHGTCRRMGGDIAGYEARAATFGKVIDT